MTDELSQAKARRDEAQRLMEEAVARAEDLFAQLSQAKVALREAAELIEAQFPTTIEGTLHHDAERVFKLIEDALIDPAAPEAKP